MIKKKVELWAERGEKLYRSGQSCPLIKLHDDPETKITSQNRVKTFFQSNFVGILLCLVIPEF